MAGLDLQQRRLLLQKRGVIARPRGQRAAIQFQQAGRQPLQQGTVVSDEQQPAAKFQQLLLQPLDGFQIEMVGRLVQQQ